MSRLDSRTVAILAISVLGFVVYRKFRRGIDSLGTSSGTVISDITSALNGNHRIEFTPLVVRPNWLDSEWRLTSDARKVYLGIKQYRPLMDALFGSNLLGAMPFEYRHFLGVPIKWSGSQVLRA